MERLNTEKLFVDYMDGVSKTEPIEGRKYTLTHSDETADIFLSIGLSYNYEKITSMRDEVLAEWNHFHDQYSCIAYCYVGGEISQEMAGLRYRIFVRELPLALEAIRYGDRALFEKHTELDDAPIWIYFDSSYPQYNKLENWGKFKYYK